MPRKPLIRVDNRPYHVTIRSNNKEWFDLPMKLVWKICIDALRQASFKYPVKIDSFVLMSNHYHLLLYTPNADIDKFMSVLNSTISREIRSYTGRINRIFGDRYRWKLINCDQYYQNVIRYVFQNPIKAKITKRCEDYLYSTLYYQLKNIEIGFTLPTKFIGSRFIEFINDDFESSEISKALRVSGPSHN